jgi:hypothetical protein
MENSLSQSPHICGGKGRTHTQACYLTLSLQSRHQLRRRVQAHICRTQSKQKLSSASPTPWLKQVSRSRSRLPLGTEQEQRTAELLLH